MYRVLSMRCANLKEGHLIKKEASNNNYIILHNNDNLIESNDTAGLNTEIPPWSPPPRPRKGHEKRAH